MARKTGGRARREVRVVAVGLVERDRRVLVRVREPGKPMAGLWEFPGGKVEFGEAPDAALRREVKEETGLVLGALDLVDVVAHAYPEEGVHVILIVFHATVGPRAEVHDPSARWVTREEAAALEMPEANARILRHLARFA